MPSSTRKWRAKSRSSLSTTRDCFRHHPKSSVLEVPLLAEAPDFATLGDFVLAIAAPEAMRV